MSMCSCLFPKLLPKRISQSPEPVVLRLGGGRGREKDSLSVQTFTPPQPPSEPNVTSTKCRWFSFSGK